MIPWLGVAQYQPLINRVPEDAGMPRRIERKGAINPSWSTPNQPQGRPAKECCRKEEDYEPGADFEGGTDSWDSAEQLVNGRESRSRANSARRFGGGS